MINHGVTGPNVRAAGVDYDVRWAHPYSVYSELDWQPSVERSSIKGADCYDRYRVRVEEMRMSASMVLQALDKMPGGSETYHEPGDPKILAKAPSRAPEGTYGSHHFEDSRGESMFYIAGGGEGRGKMPYRINPFSNVHHNSLCCKVHDWLQSGRHSCHYGFIRSMYWGNRQVIYNGRN